jgi:Ser/Thr protein kinase RdoA (MazF antagonist)
MALVTYAPHLVLEEAELLASDLYDISGRAESLPSERDQNFLLTTEPGDRFVLKISNSAEQLPFLEAQNQVLVHLQSVVDFCPELIPTTSGKEIVQISTEEASHYVRLVTYIPGAPLAVTSHSSRLLSNFGECLGVLTKHLWPFDHGAFHREFHWDLANGLSVINDYAQLLPKELRAMVEKCGARFDKTLVPVLPKLPRSVIHGDANDYNVIVENDQVVGLVDFGDMIFSYTVGELAVAIAYIVLDKVNPLDHAKAVASGYASEWRLDEHELDALWSLVLMRICMSICLAAHQQEDQPGNLYLSISQLSMRKSLPTLMAIDPEQATDAFRQITQQRSDSMQEN